MQNRQIGKIIGVSYTTVTTLLESGKTEQISKTLFNFEVNTGDEVFLYFDDKGEIVFTELRQKSSPSSSSDIRVTHSYSPQKGYDEGSFWGGFFLTLILPVVGLVIALVLDKSETRRGALRAVIVQAILGVLIFLLSLMGFCVAVYWVIMLNKTVYLYMDNFLIDFSSAFDNIFSLMGPPETTFQSAVTSIS